MFLEDLTVDLRKALATNSVLTSYSSIVPTVTEPAESPTTGVHDLAVGCNTGPQKLLLIPYGVGSDTNTGAIRVWGWNKIPGGAAGTSDLWVPILLADLAIALSVPTGVAGSPVVAANLFADGITITKGNADWVDVQATGTDAVTFAVILLHGIRKVQFNAHNNSSSTSVNALWRQF